MGWDLSPHAARTRQLLSAEATPDLGQLEGQRHAFEEDSAGQDESWQPLIHATLEAYDSVLRTPNDPEARARLLDALAACEARLMTEGSSAYPVQNVLLYATSAARAGTLAADVFAQVVQAAKSHFEQCAEAYHETPPLAQSFRSCAAALAELLRFTEDRDAAHLDRGLQMLEPAQAAVDENLAKLAQLRLEKGPTSSLIANAFIAAANMLKGGAMSPEMFAASLDGLEQQVRQMRRNLEKAREEAPTSATLTEQVPRIDAAVEKHEAAVASWRAWFEDQHAARLDEGIAHLIEGVAQLDAARAILEGAAITTVLCPHCGAANQGAAASCAQCGRALPRVRVSPTTGVLESETGDPDLVLTDNMKRVIDDINRVASGIITPDDFRATLDWMGGMVEVTSRRLSEAPRLDPESFPEDEREQAQAAGRLVDDTRELLGEGIQAMREALAELRSYLRDGQRQHLSDGLRLFWAASKRVYQAQRVGEMGAVRLSPGQVRVAPPPDDEDALDLREEVDLGEER